MQIYKTGIPLLLLLPILLSACAPNHLLIERAELEHLQTRFSQWDERFTELEQQQRENSERLTLQHRMATVALMQTMVAEFDQHACEPSPIPVCLSASGKQSVEKVSDDEPRRPEIPVVRIDDKQLVGGIEQVLLAPPGLLLDARVDTGAESASLDARHMQEFERDGNTWVRFSIMDRETEELFEIERRVVRHVRILQSSTDEPERRPVVEFRLTLGDFSQTAEFTLSDRSHLTFPVLIGRNVIKDVMLVDVGQAHIAPPRIPAPDNQGSR